MGLQQRLRRLERFRRQHRLGLPVGELGPRLAQRLLGRADALARRLVVVEDQHADLGLAAQLLLDERADQLAEPGACLGVVPFQVAVIARHVVGVADEDHALLVALLDHAADGVGVERQHDQGVDAAGDPGIELGQLLFRRTAGEALHDLVAEFGRFLLRGVDEALVEIGGAVGLADADALGRRQRRHGAGHRGGRQQRHAALHHPATIKDRRQHGFVGHCRFSSSSSRLSASRPARWVGRPPPAGGPAPRRKPVTWNARPSHASSPVNRGVGGQGRGRERSESRPRPTGSIVGAGRPVVSIGDRLSTYHLMIMQPMRRLFSLGLGGRGAKAVAAGRGGLRRCGSPPRWLTIRWSGACCTRRRRGATASPSRRPPAACALPSSRQARGRSPAGSGTKPVSSPVTASRSACRRASRRCWRCTASSLPARPGCRCSIWGRRPGCMPFWSRSARVFCWRPRRPRQRWPRPTARGRCRRSGRSRSARVAPASARCCRVAAAPRRCRGPRPATSPG